MSEWHWCADCDTGFCDTMWHYVTLWCLWQQNSETDVVSSCNSGMTVWLSVMSLAVAFIAETTGRASAASINRSVMITPQNIQLTCFLQNKNYLYKQDFSGLMTYQNIQLANTIMPTHKKEYKINTILQTQSLHWKIWSLSRSLDSSSPRSSPKHDHWLSSSSARQSLPRKTVHVWIANAKNSQSSPGSQCRLPLFDRRWWRNTQ